LSHIAAGIARGTGRTPAKAQQAKMLDMAAKKPMMARAETLVRGGFLKLGSHGRVTAFLHNGRSTVRMSVLDAIKLGQWDYEPREVDQRQFEATGALPGSNEKLAVMAERLQRGLPLWHPRDRRSRDDGIELS
jgi:hypothetical protein